MKNKQIYRKTALTLGLATIAAAALVACGGGGDGGTDTTPTPDPTPVAATRVVNLDFAMVSGDKEIKCGDTISGLGTTAADAQLKDARFYVSNIYLVKQDGSEVRFIPDTANDWNHVAGDNSVSLIDLEDATGACPVDTGTPAMNSRLSATVENVTYKGVRFEMGVPFALNHTNTVASDTPKPLQVQETAWSWAGGRKFSKVEVTQPTGATWTIATFNFHLGSTGCTGTSPSTGLVDSCARPGRMLVPLSSFNSETQKIAFDVKALLAGEDVTKNDGGTVTVPGTTWVNGATGCMSGATDGDCLTVYDALQIDLVAGTPINGGAAQRVFKAVAK